MMYLAWCIFLQQPGRTKGDPRVAYPRLTWEPGPKGQHLEAELSHLPSRQRSGPANNGTQAL